MTIRAFTDQRLRSLPASSPALTRDTVIARVALTRGPLDYGAWPVLGEVAAVSRKDEFSNERNADSGHVGATVYDAALAADFLAAFHALALSDDCYVSDYLDRWLVSPDRKPTDRRFNDDPGAS